MIDLRLSAEFDSGEAPFVVKLRVSDRDDGNDVMPSDELAIAREIDPGAYECHTRTRNFRILAKPGTDLDGDVLLCYPHRNSADRFYRRSSNHNTILLTERCDQLCVMCSQPPRDKESAWLFPLYERALHLVDPNVRIGITGGEPMLYKDDLIDIISNVSKSRPDISYHILSNGQHFSVGDRARLSDLHSKVDIIWGIPLYSHQEAAHNEIVAKEGAFNKVMENLFVLASSGAKIELRTVIMAVNVFDLPELATFIGKHIPFVATWALMGMEPIGYAKANFKRLFFDHSKFPWPIVNAIRISQLRNVNCQLYNIPRCTIPVEFRGHCTDSISDWKRKFLPECAECVEQHECCGFFEWYNEKWAWSGVSPILAV